MNHRNNDSVILLLKHNGDMKTVLHTADSRGGFDHGWLKTKHTFSFADYFDRSRMHFGVLRVINDDYVEGCMGFGTHPHDNMEIITIPLSGALQHRDSMGNGSVISKGDIQVMSAGTGVTHSEFNAKQDEAVTLLQIWVFPERQGVAPRYAQYSYADKAVRGQLQTILAPEGSGEGGVWIHQKAWFSLGELEAGQRLDYTIRHRGNGVYAFLISGRVRISGVELSARDGLGLWELGALDIEVLEDSQLLLMGLPMDLA